MAPGNITQALYARGLPPGVKLVVTDVTFTVPGSDWWPGFQGPHKSLYKNTSEADKQSMFPMEATSYVHNGYIGSAYLSSQSLFDTGHGPEIYIKYSLSGSTTVNGQTVDLSHVTGQITVSTTDWSLVSRPDYCNVTYQVQNQQVHNLSNAVQAGQSPKDVSFVFGVNPLEKQVGVNVAVDEDVTKDLIDYALKGIFKAHEKAVGWVVGAI
ncbi:hypothetical protein P153DRAFT_431179 [Dothidotthia symphoricarpi CBS 119687]|uniref:Uncharacterized protein n=1 Tax=Dothidotthia symphoricarpi CBS 119687 TaxID=1392245 RepID=A0A6A6AGW9_9PLEO|nr:uncharacterized protein P153DRAFT_431179 [Dothidotthia symphoricarpi CBS 119687]KAF2130137.1 hypothetical protein P153DRAFT_431179 [Dothidotthia symphoricarpi CBS 119687]